ncbi:MAG: efflux RND transporter periplasmic adaptor subunit [Bacteroidetes bacterium]|nr:efflux RND transporter periplasmic adaptor subunit [Bacteroidota bacterium]
MNKRLIFIVLPIAVLALGYILMQLFTSMREEPTRRRPPVLVRSVEARVIDSGAVPTTIEAIGRVTSTQPVQLVSEVAGLLQAGKPAFLPGQRFRKGQVLLRIDDRQVRYNLNSAKSDFLNALATVLPELKIEFPDDYLRWQEYFDGSSFDRPLGPLPESEQRKVRLLLTRFNVHKLFFAVKNLEVTLEKHTIVAPFNGAIVSTAVREGSAARVGGVLGEIISLENLELQAPIPAGDVSWIDRSRPVRLSAEGSDVSWTGTITRIGSAVDQRTQTIPVFIAVRGGGDALYEGMYLRAVIPGTPLSSAISVPRRALYEERYVYVIDGGALQRRDVTIARRQPRSVLVSAGLQRGDTLVTELLQGVSDGMPAAARLTDVEGRDK